MARAGLPLVALSLGLILVGSPLAVSDGGHGEHELGEKLEALRFYVHEFEDPGAPDPDQNEFSMNRTPPADAEAQANTCLVCAGDPYRSFNFTTDDLFDVDLDIKAEETGAFVFWIRGYHPDEAAGVPPNEVTIEFELRLTTGELVGEANETRTIVDDNAEEFRLGYKPKLDSIAAGIGLRWTVRITGPHGVYNPAASAYGSTADHPFYVSMIRIVPTAGGALQLHSLYYDTLETPIGSAATFNFTVDNHGKRNSSVALVLRGVPTGAAAAITTEAGLPVTGLFPVPAGASLRHQLRVTGLALGNHTFDIQAASTKGETATLLVLASVHEPVVAEPEEDDGGGSLPGFEAFLALAALGLAFRRQNG